MPPVARFRSVVLDCPDPRALADFYAAVLGGTPEAEDGADDWIVLRVPGGPRVAFQQVEGYTPPEWPRADRNPQQFHLDLDGYTDYPALSDGPAQPSSDSIVAWDGDRVA
ncbi:VOC family protein [Streptomyces zaehneri]|uniref:VOC family protein n=1 Tax=Streptomyces zaehneri TaxID=3051180 RepID=UPI0028D31594|nr:VOC family protein [Streptomyces sp. DSM 40713]